MTGIDLEVADDVATLTISNPGMRNAIAPSFLPEIGSALDEIRDDVRCLVVTGAGDRAFSSGMDLSELNDQAFFEEHEPIYESVLQSLAKFPYPTIANVNGDAIGGGFDLCLSCDLRIGSAKSRFGVPTARIGIVYTVRAIRQMVRTLGPAYTKELLYTADLVDASRAAEMGIVNEVVPADRVDGRVDELATTIASNAPRSLSVSKRIVETVLDADHLSATEREFIEQLRAEALQSEDFEEGRAAIAEGRDPEFTGS